jgi:hypothetical protein
MRYIMEEMGGPIRALRVRDLKRLFQAAAVSRGFDAPKETPHELIRRLALCLGYLELRSRPALLVTDLFQTTPSPPGLLGLIVEVKDDYSVIATHAYARELLVRPAHIRTPIDAYKHLKSLTSGGAVSRFRSSADFGVFESRCECRTPLKTKAGGSAASVADEWVRAARQAGLAEVEVFSLPHFAQYAAKLRKKHDRQPR